MSPVFFITTKYITKICIVMIALKLKCPLIEKSENNNKIISTYFIYKGMIIHNCVFNRYEYNF